MNDKLLSKEGLVTPRGSCFIFVEQAKLDIANFAILTFTRHAFRALVVMP